MSSPIAFDATTNTAVLGNAPLVFHCHHYNCALQHAVETALGPTLAAEVQRAAAQEVVRVQQAALAPRNAPPADVLARAAALFCELGFGRLDLARLGPRGGTAVITNSHYAMGWVAKYGPRATPACHFPTGFVAAAFVVAHGLAPERVRAIETVCFAAAEGADECRIDVEVR